ncbi:MAG: transposase [Acidimicrobiaceae bacterium]|nr:transposase [Acidimicrobiaceae bacterium]
MGVGSGPAPVSGRCWAGQGRHAVRVVLALRGGLGTSVGAVTRVARRLGYGVESVREWVAQAEIGAGNRAGVATSESAELKRLRQENRELRRANEILQRAAVLRDRRTGDGHDRRVHRPGPGRVRLCCFAGGSTCWSARRRPPSQRSKRDAVMTPMRLALWQAYYSVYGAS